MQTVMAARLGLMVVPEAQVWMQASKAENTQRAYQAAWGEFVRFCEVRDVPALPALPSTVVEYVMWLAGHVRPSTIQVKMAAVAFAHRAAHVQSPSDDEGVQAVLSRIRRRLGTAPRQKAPVTLVELERMIRALPDGLRGRRDRALLLVGFAGTFRRPYDRGGAI